MEAVLEYITIYAPVLVAVVSEIGVVATMITKTTSYFKKASAAVDELKESTEYKELKNQMKIVIDENIELKKKLNVVMEKLTHVKVQDETDGNNEKV